MGYEKTLPSNHLIALFSALSVVTLGGLHFVFDSYFSEVSAREVSDKVLSVEPVTLQRLRDDEKRRLDAANISNRMKEIAGGARPASITPLRGVDLETRLTALGAVSGWAEDSRPLALATAKREEAHAYLSEMRASVEKARAEGNTEALDTLLPRLKTAEEAVIRLEHETQELLGNQTEAGVATVRNPSETVAQPGDEVPSGDPPQTGAQEAPKQEAPKQEAPKQEAPKQEARIPASSDAGRKAPKNVRAADAGQGENR